MGFENPAGRRKEHPIWKKAATGLAMAAGFMGAGKTAINKIVDGGSVHRSSSSDTSRDTSSSFQPARNWSDVSNISDNTPTSDTVRVEGAMEAQGSSWGNEEYEQQLANQEAQQTAAQNEAEANAPVANDGELDYIGASFVQNFLNNPESIQRYLGKPREFDDFLRSQLRTQTRATADASLQVDIARDEALKGLRHQAEALAESGDLPSAVSYMALADAQDAYDFAIQHGRADLAAEVIKNAATSFNIDLSDPRITSSVGRGANSLDPVLRYFSREDQAKLQQAWQQQQAAEENI